MKEGTEYVDVPPESDTSKKSTATALIELAQEHYTFGVSTTREPFAVPTHGPKVVSMLRGSRASLRGRLARLYFQRERRAAPQQALADALACIEGLADESEPADLHIRVGRADDDLWLDLGDDTGRAVCISPGGWEIEAEPPIMFKRTVLTGPLPEPQRGGDLDELWRHVNIARPDRPLLVSWLVASQIPEIPHPALALTGEQGAGKTTAQKLVVNAIDPGPAPTRKPPRDAESWVTAAAGSWVVGIDNMSTVPDWLSDSICRAVTGEGDVRRKLYTDGEYAVFAYRRCVVLSSIDLGAIRGDLAERLLPITLSTIPDERRLRDAEIAAAWDRAHPRVLGAILDLAAEVLRVLPDIDLAGRPRMADFAEVVAAVDQVLGTAGFARYAEVAGAIARDSVTSDAFIAELQKVGVFEGTAAELLGKVTPEKPPRDWPRSARAVTQLLRRHSPAMRRTGWTISDDGAENQRKVLRWTIEAPDREMTSNSSPPSPSSPSPEQLPGLTDGDCSGDPRDDRGGDPRDSGIPRTYPREPIARKPAPDNGFGDGTGITGNTGVENGPSPYEPGADEGEGPA